MKILNLYAGLGGNRKLWGADHSVTAVEIDPEIAAIYKKFFPKDNIIIGDAHSYLLEHIYEYDFIWSSSPCPSHSLLRLTSVYKGQNKPVYPDMNLYAEIIFLKYYSKKKTKWAVENVDPFYDFLIKPQIQINRHSFWTNFYVAPIEFKENETPIEETFSSATRYGFNLQKFKMSQRKDQLLRNLVNPEIGAYILSESQKGIKPLFNFNY